MRRESPHGGSSQPRTLVAVLDSDPDLAEDLSSEQLKLARRRALAELVICPPGPWSLGPDDIDGVANLGLLLLEGLLTREVTVGGYTCAELLGPGDVLQPWLRIGPDHSVASEVVGGSSSGLAWLCLTESSSSGLPHGRSYLERSRAG
jgi:hypothetical protein